jgi:hypothetical protein
MLKQLVMRVSGLMERLFMGRSLSMAEQLLLNARPLHAKSTQESQKPAQHPVPRKRKPKSKVAQADITATSHKRTPKSAHQIPGQDGLQPVTPASQPASQSRKRKPSAAQPTTAEQSPKQTQKPARTTSGKDGLQPAQLVPQTRLPASKQQTVKQKPAVSTKAVKKATKGSTPAAILTVRKSKARGA